MKKSLKILVFSLICVFFIFAENCLAVNIDMNLSSNLVDSGNLTDFGNYNSNSYYNDDDFNIDDLDDNTLSNYTSNGLSNSDSASSNSTSNTATAPSSNRGSSIADALQSLPESELGLTNILNILLIAVGVVLILLSIAIFIRLKH